MGSVTLQACVAHAIAIVQMRQLHNTFKRGHCSSNMVCARLYKISSTVNSSLGPNLKARTTGYLRFHPMAQCVVHAFKGLACRASPSRAYRGHKKHSTFLQWVQNVGTWRNAPESPASNRSLNESHSSNVPHAQMRQLSFLNLRNAATHVPTIHSLNHDDILAELGFAGGLALRFDLVVDPTILPIPNHPAAPRRLNDRNNPAHTTRSIHDTRTFQLQTRFDSTRTANACSSNPMIDIGILIYSDEMVRYAAALAAACKTNSQKQFPKREQ
jgi:hypothetical protein